MPIYLGHNDNAGVQISVLDTSCDCDKLRNYSRIRRRRKLLYEAPKIQQLLLQKKRIRDKKVAGKKK